MAARSADKPNFVVILTDDQSWVGSSLLMDPDDVRTRSDDYYTPHIERLAEMGTVHAGVLACGILLPYTPRLYGLIFTTVILAVLLAVTQLIGLLAARGTLGHFVFGFAVVDAAGEPASRARLFARWLIACSSLPFTSIILVLGGPEESAGGPQRPTLDALAMFALITSFVALLTWFVGLVRQQQQVPQPRLRVNHD